MRWVLPFFTIISLFSAPPAFAGNGTIDSGNTAWLLISAALVMLMTPGLAFFYAGMVNRKNVVSTLLQNYIALAVVGLMWVTIGYSLAFSEGNGWIGGTSYFLLRGLENSLYGDGSAGIPHYAFIAFQMMFAAITPAIITGAIAERVNFKAWVLVLALWSALVYIPVAHWVWGPKGWIGAMGALDFAGGLVVHVTAGTAGLVAAIMYGRRISAGRISRPNDVSMIMLGAALLWFGWFGFNGGSALTAGTQAAHAFITTYVGAAAAFVSWLAVDWIKHRRPSAVGAAIGLVVGLVVITPAAGYVTVESAMLMGGFAGAFCNLFAHFIKTRARLDDTLDVFACHGLGGILGALMTGLFASREINPGLTAEGLFVSGEISLFMANALSVLVVTVFTAIMTYLLLKCVNFIAPIRVHREAEDEGLDTSLHGEMLRVNDRRGYE